MHENAANRLRELKPDTNMPHGKMNLHASKQVKEQKQVPFNIKDKALHIKAKQQSKRGKSTGGSPPHNYKVEPAELPKRQPSPSRIRLSSCQPNA